MNVRTLVSRLADTLLRRSRERRLEQEIQAHLDLLCDEYVKSGMTDADAKLAARRSFGGVDQIKEQYRDQRGLPVLEVLRQDVTFAFRLMRKNPGFSLTAVSSLALSIAALTMSFSIVNAFVFKPLPIRDPSSVYFMQGGWSYPDYRDLRERIDGAEFMGYRISMMSVGIGPQATILWGYLATGNYFDALGVTPAAGRFFTPAEDTAPGASPFAVISFDAWQRRFGGQPDIVGRDITINGRPFKVLGVAPKDFHGTEVFYRPDIWVPMTMQAEIEVGSSWLARRETMNVMLLARLRPGLSKAEGEAQIRTAVTTLSGEHPRNGVLTVRLTRPGLFGDSLGAPARAFAWGIFGLGAVLMLAGCSNLAGLLLARGNDRTREIVLRSAIGAGRMRIARQLITESILLASCGGAAGAALAWAGLRAASAWRMPTELPAQLDLRADGAVMLFAIGVSIAIGVIVGIAPARFATRLDLNQSLKGQEGITVGRRRFQGREILVVIQVALCVVLLQASFLAVRGLQRAATASLGWNPDGLVMAATELGLARYTSPQFLAYQERVLRETRQLPGVDSVSLSNSMPLHLDQSNTAVYPFPATEPETPIGATKYEVSPGFFATLQISITGGRDFSEFDTGQAPEVAINNQTLADWLFPGTAAIGRQLRQGRGGRPVTIVGIVANGKYVSLGESPRGAIFRPLTQEYSTSSMLIARTRPGTRVTPDTLGSLVRNIDPALAIRISATGEQLTALPLLPYRVAVIALGLLGVIGSGLLLSGLHAMLAYAVARRRREIGIRIALGADRGRVIGNVLSRALTIVAIGTGAGTLISFGTGPLVSALVLGVSPRDPVMLAAIAAGLGIITAISCAGPVRRSLSIDPLTALRDE
jgi:predicted permease